MAFKEIIGQLNIRGQCRRYGVPLRQCPQFLFVVMGVVIIVSAIFSYFTGTRYIADPQIVAFGVLLLSTVLFVIGYTIAQGFEHLAEASRLKSEFISIVSHQLRTPITNLRWSVDMLLSGRLDHVTVSEKQMEYFHILEANIARMNELVQDLLMVSRLEQGRLPLKPQEIKLADFMKEIMGKFQPSAQTAQINLQCNIDPEKMHITTDLSQLKIATENLIENGIRYTAAGGSVDINVVQKNGDMTVRVKDSGIGIPQKDQKFLFQKFFRTDKARTHQPQGTGLGLYITKTIVKTLGGAIGFESQENKGSTFWFTLPVLTKR